MEKIYFVGGIGTDVGKTVATGLMARYLISRGIDATTLKLVQTGSPRGGSEDVAAHRRICGAPGTDEDRLGLTAPQVFRYPSSPALAARLEGREVDIRAIDEAVDKVSSRHEVLLVEAAGGLAVPLTDDLLMVDFAAKRDWPLILVANTVLGSINHTILSLEAARAHNVRLAGVVMNEFPSAPKELVSDAYFAVKKALSRLGCEERVSTLPFMPGPQEGCFRPIDVDFKEIFP